MKMSDNKKVIEEGVFAEKNMPIIRNQKAEGQLLGKSWDKDNPNKKEKATEILYSTNLQDGSR